MRVEEELRKEERVRGVKELKEAENCGGIKDYWKKNEKKGSKLQIASLKYGVIEFYILKFQNLDFISDDIWI